MNNKKEIKTQAELDSLKRVEENESVHIIGENLRLNAKIEVFGFLGIEYDLNMDWGRHVEAWDSSKVVARGSSKVVARGSSNVVAYDSSKVVARDSSKVVAWDSSNVVAWGSSNVVAWGSSNVVAYDSSKVVARDSSKVVAWDSSKVEAWGTSVSWSYSSDVIIQLFGWSVAYQMFKGKGKITKKDKTTVIIKVPPQQSTFLDYSKRYPIVKKGNKYLFYKAVHKKDDKYFSDFDKNFSYEIGKTYQQVCDSHLKGSCSKGLHVAHKSWAIRFGYSWSDFALLECEVDKKDIVVSSDTDGKIRCSKLKVLREVPTNEC